jgi:hypothetical protein
MAIKRAVSYSTHEQAMSDKVTSLLHCSINYDHKKFYFTGLQREHSKQKESNQRLGPNFLEALPSGSN